MAVLAETFSRNGALVGALLLTFFYCRGAFAELESKSTEGGLNGSPTRIKRERQIERKKTSGYHNAVRSPSRVGGDESYLLVAEEPKTDEERTSRRFEAVQLPKILSVLKSGNFAKAEQMLKDLASAMPVDSQARYLYQTLAERCESRRDAEYWYRYDIRESRRWAAGQSAADVPVSTSKATKSGPLANDSVHDLRKEAWLLLSTQSKK